MQARFSRRYLVTSLIVIAVFFTLGRLTHAPTIRTVHLGSKFYKLQVASTVADKQKGLGGRSDLSPNRGMEFPYGKTTELCFWMKDTLIPLDMIWLDSHRQVVEIKTDVQPQSYPKSYCAQAQYVVELHAGQVAQAGIHIGETAYGL
jgi:uncharacterized membrane protein (UPF0127 family)